MIVVIAMAVLCRYFYIQKLTEIREKQQIGNIFLKIGEKRRLFWIGNGAEYGTLVIGRKGPALFHQFDESISIIK